MSTRALGLGQRVGRRSIRFAMRHAQPMLCRQLIWQSGSPRCSPPNPSSHKCSVPSENEGSHEESNTSGRWISTSGDPTEPRRQRGSLVRSWRPPLDAVATVQLALAVAVQPPLAPSVPPTAQPPSVMEQLAEIPEEEIWLAKQKSGFSLHVSISEAMHAQFAPPSSLPANRLFFLDRMIGFIARSMLFVSSSMRPSARNCSRPFQWFSA